jgi:cold shock CspA family protein
MLGTVVAFDEQRGLGELETDDGARYGFHCTQIVDGTRTIPVSASVEFQVAPGHLGAWEAVQVTPRG